MSVIIAKNDSTADIQITDLNGVTVLIDNSLNLTNYFGIDVISNSTVLKTLVEDEYIIINDGINDLSIENGLKHIALKTEYENHIAEKSSRDIHISFGGESISYTPISSMTWAVVSPFIFLGTNLLGIPSSVKIISNTNLPNVTGSVRLFDRNNNNQICLFDQSINSDIINIYSTDSFSNLPTSECIMEIQCKVHNNGKKIYMYELVLVF